jgi:hypothetical protein
MKGDFASDSGSLFRSLFCYSSLRGERATIDGAMTHHLERFDTTERLVMHHRFTRMYPCIDIASKHARARLAKPREISLTHIRPARKRGVEAEAMAGSSSVSALILRAEEAGITASGSRGALQRCAIHCARKHRVCRLRDMRNIGIVVFCFDCSGVFLPSHPVPVRSVAFNTEQQGKCEHSAHVLCF